MFRFITLLLAFSAIAYSDPIPSQPDVLVDSRIVGGSSAEIEDFPYQLYLLFQRQAECGATLISPTWAVTAAHCVFRRMASGFSLTGGTAQKMLGGQVRGISEIIIHPNFNYDETTDDISLLRINRPFDLGTTIQPVELPAQGTPVTAGTVGIISGWGVLFEGGRNTPNRLQQTTVPVVDQAICVATHGRVITDTVLCAGHAAGGQDACQGDSGGPFVVDGTLIGVISWGRGCARPNTPGVYTRVSAYRNWITSITGV